MLNLILDSSSDTLILALSGGEKPLFRVWEEAARIGSQLLCLVSSFLEDHGVTPDSLSHVAVGRGPGSYTGTRAAVAAATGFSMGADIPLIHFPSLLVFLPPEDPCVALLEVKGSKDLFGLFYAQGKVTEKTVSREELTQELPLRPLVFIPDVAIARIENWITEQTPQSKKLVYLKN
jgi:tRNA threonylcarbamoyl adenosine modification protein YeaZ